MLNRKVSLLVVRSASRKEMLRATAKKSIVDDARMGFGMLEEQNRQENIFIIVTGCNLQPIIFESTGPVLRAVL